jgi:hypothetical protein
LVETPSSAVPGPRGGAGILLFLAVTVCWTLGSAAWEQGWITYTDLVVLVAAVLSTVSVVVTGYLGRVVHALWLGWIPGAAMMAIGFAMTPEPGGDETGWTMIFFGGLLLGLGWPIFFFPLIAVGAGLRRRHSPATTTPAPPPESA